MTAIDLTAAIEAALSESYRPRREPGYSFLSRSSYDNLWGPHVEAMVEAALPHIREALAQQVEAFTCLEFAFPNQPPMAVLSRADAARIVRGDAS